MELFLVGVGSGPITLASPFIFHEKKRNYILKYLYPFHYIQNFLRFPPFPSPVSAIVSFFEGTESLQPQLPGLIFTAASNPAAKVEGHLDCQHPRPKKEKLEGKG